jgi:hypothetical protein
MLPNRVNDIVTTSQCREMVLQARDAAITKATALNDPTFYQYADAFNIFANADQALVKTYANNRQSLVYQGGCDLLSRDDTREALWPSAKKVLFQQLQRYHANLSAMPYGEDNPTLNCYTYNDGKKNNGKWLCPPQYNTE